MEIPVNVVPPVDTIHEEDSERCPQGGRAYDYRAHRGGVHGAL